MANIFEYIIAIGLFAIYIYYCIQKKREEREKEESYEQLLNQDQD